MKKRELVFLQFRLNGSSEDFSAIDYLLFSSFQEFLQRWLSQWTVACHFLKALCMLGVEGVALDRSPWPRD